MAKNVLILMGSPRKKGNTSILISACMSPDESWCGMMVDSFRNYLACYDETVTEGGYVFGFGVGAPGDVKGTDAMQKTYDMGRKIS